MARRRKFTRKPTALVTAVQLDLDTEGFTYNKWGSTQKCRRGDWLVNNNGDTYTVARESFARTYERVSQGVYIKSAPVWAEIAAQDGTVTTNEGVRAYKAGDYLVSNNEDGTDAYAISAQTFHTLYDPADA